MATYFCSDPHAFHGNIMKYCRRLAFMTPADREAFLAIEAERWRHAFTPRERRVDR